MGTDMGIKNIIISATVLCSVAFTQSISGQARAKAAYLSSNIGELVNIACSDTGEDSKLATEFIAISDIGSLDLATLQKLAQTASASSNKGVSDLLNTLVKERKLDIVTQFEDMTAEQLYTSTLTSPAYRSIADDFVRNLSEGLDSLTFHELRYLRLNCPLFNKGDIAKASANHRHEIAESLESQMKSYRDFEVKSMERFTAALQYKLMEGLLKQIKKFAIAYSMDQDMEESLPSYIYNSYMELLRKYWNEGIIYDYVLAQTKNYNEGLDKARAELLKNLGISGKKQNVIQIPRMDTNITIGMGGFNKIGNIRSDLNGTAFGAGVVAGLASFLTGGFLANVGESLYMSEKKVEAARAELPHRRAYLNATYDKLQLQTEKELKSMAGEMKKQQEKQSQAFYDYVIQNY